MNSKLFLNLLFVYMVGTICTNQIADAKKSFTSLLEAIRRCSGENEQNVLKCKSNNALIEDSNPTSYQNCLSCNSFGCLALDKNPKFPNLHAAQKYCVTERDNVFYCRGLDYSGYDSKTTAMNFCAKCATWKCNN